MRKLVIILAALLAGVACGQAEGQTTYSDNDSRSTPTQRVCAEWKVKEYGIDGYNPGMKCARWR